MLWTRENLLCRVIKGSFSHVESKVLGLEVPQVTELAYMLKKSGLNIEDGILTVEELMMQINENR